jgi:uncharacterized repeat protein (TIGR01451 family)
MSNRMSADRGIKGRAIDRRRRCVQGRRILGQAFRRALFQPLEERVMLDIAAASSLPPTIVVGRTLSAYDVPDVQNNQETLTFTVYNQASDPITGVLLTDTLENGVTFASASQLPDQNGQELAWSLGTIQPYGRASVTLTVSLANPIPTQLDTGASAYGTLDAGMVSWTTAPATLRTTAIAPDLLASTPDANTTDPYIQEEAAQLNYDPTQIYNFLQTQIGFNSYSGSLRGARGTLWSNSGNSLDVASLGVALMRAGGIPAQYEEGTLVTAQAQQLILSMFPASYQTVGYIPAGTQTSDPANDPQLLSETEDHFWFQFDAGSGMTNADPEFASQAIGQEATASTNNFTEVPASLRATTEIKLSAEMYSQAAAVFAPSRGNSLSDTVVLDQTFNDVDLVGHPLTIGNFVSGAGLSAAVANASVFTYSPYIEISDDANPDPSQDTIIRGTDYQEVLTNFAFGSQVLTGLFLNITTSGPTADATPPQTVQKTLYDRIGPAARESGAPISLNLGSTPQLALSSLDLVTLQLSTGTQPLAPLQPLVTETSQLSAQDQQAAANITSSSASSTSNSLQQLSHLTIETSQETSALWGATFFAESDPILSGMENTLLARAYYDTPRVVAVSSNFATDAANASGTLSYNVDILADSPRVVVVPDQSTTMDHMFHFVHGFADSVVEGQILNSNQATNVAQASSSLTAFLTAMSASPTTIVLAAPGDLAQLDGLPLSADVKARIATEVEAGFVLIIPSNTALINGAPTTAWLEINPATDDVLSVSEDGTHSFGDQSAAYEIADTQIVVGETAATDTETELAAIDAARAGGQLTADIARANAQFRAAQIGQQLTREALKQITLTALFKFDTYVNTKLLWKYDVSTQANKILLDLFKPQFNKQINIIAKAIKLKDPPLIGFTLAPPVPTSVDQANATATGIESTIASGVTTAQENVDEFQANGQLQATWTTSTMTGIEFRSLNADESTVVGSNGQAIGSGAAALLAPQTISGSVVGNLQIAAKGNGSFSFYGSAERALGVSADWTNYSATLTGAASITVTTDALVLNGVMLPAGTYTITSGSMSVSGSGTTASPNFTGSASVDVADGIIDIGPGTGSLIVGGSAVGTGQEVTLNGYIGTVHVSANSNGTDALSLDGNAVNAMTIVASPGNLSTAPNIAVSFEAEIQTSLPDAYNLTVNAPTGWAASISATGTVTVTPAPGTTPGTYPIQIIAESTTDADLLAQSVVNVTVGATSPGMTFSVHPDALITVPYVNTEIPSAFQATVVNTGPSTDTYNLSFSNLPVGFAISSSGTTVSVPAGGMGVLGVYLQPAGSQLPPPGTNVSFTVTATSTTNASITKTIDVSFTMPAIEAVTVTSAPITVATTPGTSTTATVIIANVGNVQYDPALATTTDSGLSITGLTTAGLISVGQSINENIALTPNSSTPLNSILNATINVAPAVAQDVISVLSVTPSLTSISAGQSVEFSADVFSAVAQQEQGEVSFAVSNSQGVKVFSSPNVPVMLSTIGSVAMLDLGNFSTAGLAPGAYSVEVTVADSTGASLAQGAGGLVVGLPISADLSIDSDNQATGAATTNETLNVSSNALTGTASTPVTVSVTVSTNGVSIVPTSFSILPTSTIAGANSETFNWNLDLAAGEIQQITWETNVDNLQANEVQTIVTSANVQFTNGAVSQTISLPGLNVVGVPTPVTLVIPVQTAVPGAVAITNAMAAATALGMTGLATQLGDLSTALTNLVESPTDAMYKSQALAALASILSLMANDLNLEEFVAPMTAARDQLAAANTTSDIQTAVVNLGGVLTNFGTLVTDLEQSNVQVTLIPSSVVAQPGVAQNFDVRLQNLGTQATTYDLSVSGLPASVTSQFAQSSVTINPGQTVDAMLTLTQSAGSELVATSFQVSASAEGVTIPLIKSATGALTARQQFISVSNISVTPPFANPGTQIALAAQLLNAVNENQQGSVSYSVTDTNGNTVLTSAATPVTLTVQASLATVDLPALDTTGFANGQYTIAVTVDDSSGQPIPGATANATLLIGSPISATQTVSPQVLPTGDSTVTNTLTINSHAPLGNSFTLVGQLPDSSMTSSNTLNSDTVTGVALDGNDAYVFGTQGVHVVDISDPTNPQALSTQTDFPQTNGVVAGNQLIAINSGTQSSVAVDENSGLTNYDLSGLGKPQSPFRTQTLFPNYTFANSLVVSPDGTHAYVSYEQETYDTGNDTITAQNGTLISFDISNPSNITYNSPNSILFNTNGSNDTSPLFQNGGNNNLFEIAQPNASTLLVGASSSTGGDTQAGVGEVLSVDVSNPDNINSDPPNTSKVINALQIPGTVQVHGIAIDGNTALIVASQGGWLSPFTTVNDIGPTGDLVLATIDISNPDQPALIHEQTLSRNARGGGDDLISLGNHLFAFSSLGESTDTPEIIVVDATDPNNLQVVDQIQTPGEVRGLATNGQYLFASGDAGLLIYSISGVGSIPVTAQVEVPNGTGVSVVPGSFNVPPTQVISGSQFNTLEWDFTLDPNNASQTLTWQTAVSGMQPGESRAVTVGTTVGFNVESTPGQVTLPPQEVVADQILELSPAQQTTQPGQTADFTVTVLNPTSSEVTYNLAVQGLPQGWAQVAGSVTVPAGGQEIVPLTITSDPFAALGDDGFAVTAAAGGTSGSVAGTLLLAGQPVLPPSEPDARGVVATITAVQATAGQGNPAVYTVTLTNTGSITDTYTLTGNFPNGFTGTFSQASVSVPPGASNFRDVQLTLTPPVGATAQDYPFTVTATSTSDDTVQSQAGGTATVVAQGVQVSLTPSSGSPGGTFDLKVTNTGSAIDTFNLALASPGGLVSTSGANSVTLAAGASQTVPISTSGVNFADPGALALTGMATSQTNSAVQDQATANLSIASTQSVTAAFNPPQQDLASPGATSFLLQVNNTGNTEDRYSATITGTTGDVTASLVGLDGQPTQSVPLFVLPGLSQGAILLQVSGASSGQGTVTVAIQSLTNSSEKATATATLNVASPVQVQVVLSTNSGLSPVEGSTATIATSVLEATVPGVTTAANDIVYTLTSLPSNGSLLLGGQALALGGTFTQDDIDNGQLSYQAHEEGGDSFGFNVAATNAVGTSGTFVIATSDPAVVATGGFTYMVTEGTATASQAVATFTDPGGVEPLADYAATINWGDGTSATPGIISVDPHTHVFTVAAGHSYSQDGTFTVEVTLTHEATPPVAAIGSAQIAQATITGSGGIAASGVPFHGYEYSLPTSVTVATFTDGDGSLPAADFIATINWGDGTTSAGSVTFSTAGAGETPTPQYTVSGAHTYLDEGHFTVQVSIGQTAGTQTSGTTSATASATATIHEQLLPNGAIGTPDQNFIQEIYRDLFGRAAETSGLDFWVAKLQGGESRQQVAYEMVQLSTPEEFQRDTVAALYEQYLGRAVDPQGQHAWAAYLFNGGTIEGMSELLVSSPEYWHVRAGGTDVGFLHALFQDALGREIDPGAFTFFTNLMSQGLTPAAVAATVFNSDEYHRTRVNALFEQFLDRPADPGALAAFAAELDGGATDETAIAQIISSDEYFAIPQV